MQRPVKVSAYPKTEETRSPEHIHTLRHSPLRRRCECVTNFSGINVLLLPTTTYLKTMDLFQVCGYLRLLVYIITTLSTSSLCIVLDVLSTVHGREHVPSRHTCSMYLRSNALMHSKVYEQSPREASHKSRQHGHALLRRTSPVKHTDTFPEEPGTWLDKQRHSSCAVPAGQTDLAVAADRRDACPNANRIQTQTASVSTYIKRVAASNAAFAPTRTSDNAHSASFCTTCARLLDDKVRCSDTSRASTTHPNEIAAQTTPASTPPRICSGATVRSVDGSAHEGIACVQIASRTKQTKI